MPFFLLGVSQAQQLPVAPALLAAASTPVAPAPVAVTREDWTRLAVDPANFNQLLPALGGIDGNDKFEREFLQLQWREGDPVELYVVRPKGVANPPVVLYLYGYDDSLDRFKNDDYCQRLTSRGYAAVGFESALAFDRFRKRPMQQWFVSELQEALGSSVHDVQQVLNYLESRKDLDLNHAGIFGRDSGGAIAILAAAVDPRLKAVDTLNPWGDWPDWLANSPIIPANERADYLTPEFLAKVKPLEPVDWLPKVKASALRLQFVTGSPSVPELAMEHMEAAAAHDATTPRFTVARYQNTQDLIQQTDHGKLYDWIKDRLRPDGRSEPDAKPAAQPQAKSAPSSKTDANQ